MTALLLTTARQSGQCRLRTALPSGLQLAQCSPSCSAPRIALPVFDTARRHPRAKRTLYNVSGSNRHASTLADENSTNAGQGSSLARRLAEEHQLPIFCVPEKRAKLIDQPSEFYEELLEMIKKASRRIILTSLYIGKSEQGLIDALARALREKPDLHVTIVVDNLRSTREGPYTGTASSESCASLLAGLQLAFPTRAHIRLYRAAGLPALLEKLIGKRFVEGWGLQHMKIYGGDDTVVITGANLSNDYFTNRRDRYISIKDAALSVYLHDIAMTVARYSFQLIGDLPRENDGDSRHAPYRLAWDEGHDLPFNVNPNDEQTGSERWSWAMQRDMEAINTQWRKCTPRCKDEDSVDVVPLLQMGPISITHETQIVPQIIQAANANEGSRLDFTTGYFSINPLYAKAILHGSFICNMITAAPQSNGFYGSKGVSRHLPAAYTWLTYRFWRKLKRYNRSDVVLLSEWSKPGWTYHAKGIWLFAPRSRRPFLSLLGSSNFGTRSAQLDLECTLLIDATRSTHLQRLFGNELRDLSHGAIDPVDAELFARPERAVPLGVKIAAYLIKRML